MPSKDRDGDGDPAAATNDRSRDKHRRSKSERKSDRDRDRDKDRDHEHRHRSSRSSRSKLGDQSEVSHSSTKKHRRRPRDPDEPRERASSTSDLAASASRTSLGSTRISMPYPSFSKAHSKEAILSRDDLGARASNPLTPDTTDVGGEDARRSKSAELPRRSSTKKSSRPPSPPETDLAGDKRGPTEAVKKDEAELETPRPASRTSTPSRTSSPQIGETSKVSSKSRTSSQATYVKTPANKSHDKVRTSSRASSLSRESIRRSASNRSVRRRDGNEAESSPSSVQDSSPQTPTQQSRLSPSLYYDVRPDSAAPAHELGEDLHSKTATPASTIPAPPPPPPPPPPEVDLQDIPRVDYLLQNGGLNYPVSKQFLSVLPRQNGTRPSNPPLVGSETLFAPFFQLLDQYKTVLDKSGSIAVATGHRSIARRLLDRLENVFSRDLPAHGCSCVCCDERDEKRQGLTWGDVLEWVSGRIELPQWPPFDLAEISTKAAEVSAEEPKRPDSPIKMDPDIAEEFREHYLRQSKKVRSAVDKWLTNTGETPVPPPQDVDDETLTFAVLTNLDPSDRPYFNALLTGAKELKSSYRAPTPLIRQRNDFIIKCGLSLQRLYRLSQVPRDAETACYLIKNPYTHDLLVTMANINNSEWEILTSGRFDGFLWSGAETDDGFGSRPASAFGQPLGPMSPGVRGPSAMGSRNTTPFSMYSRGTTPASFVSLTSGTTSGGRHAVSNDEEMEMAAIAEIEREIYTGMEALEDAFEKLHLKAEVVRTALRQRGAGLMQNLQSRRRVDVLPTATPGSAGSVPGTWGAIGADSEAGGSDSEWGMDDIDIMPDDSASNISSSRHRRPKRRTERRTPAPIEEDEEER
ncbi:hypothetical protein NLU13_0246 [Sarocladium strictum]|uniref:Uncharacterized protein n=1 Tax=Sarocladium strictum TaxID=5046 RepID=A0AA39GNP9_SARSR|nr:hypothetical protein NLU13_0246 [Sarocladium strictum]